MDVSSIIGVVTKEGLGVASFIALMYFGYAALGWMDKIAENHLFHVQETLDKISEKLDEVINNTKKDV